MPSLKNAGGRHHDYVKELIVEFHWQMNETLSRERHEALRAALAGRVRVTGWY